MAVVVDVLIGDVGVIVSVVDLLVPGITVPVSVVDVLVSVIALLVPVVDLFISIIAISMPAIDPLISVPSVSCILFIADLRILLLRIFVIPIVNTALPGMGQIPRRIAVICCIDALMRDVRITLLFHLRYCSDHSHGIVTPLHGRSLARLCRELDVHVRSSELLDSLLALLIIQARCPGELVHHGALADVVHCAGDGAGIDRHVWPPDDEAHDDSEGHESEDSDRDPDANVVGDADLGERVGDVSQENRHELGKDRHESHDGWKDLSVLDGRVEAREAIGGTSEKNRVGGWLGAGRHDLEGNNHGDTYTS